MTRVARGRTAALRFALLAALAPARMLTADALWQPARGQAPPGRAEASAPATGKLGPGLEPLDRAVAMMNRHGIPGAGLAVTRDGKFVLARGFGWSDLATREPVQRDTRFGIASLSKAFTAVAVLKAVEDGKLQLEDKGFVLLSQIRPFAGARVGPQLYRITVHQLLNHSGGWGTKASGDPGSWISQVHLNRGDRSPVTRSGFIIA